MAQSLAWEPRNIVATFPIISLSFPLLLRFVVVPVKAITMLAIFPAPKEGLSICDLRAIALVEQVRVCVSYA